MQKYDFLVLGNCSANYIFQVDDINQNDCTINIKNDDFDVVKAGGTGNNIVYSLSKLGTNNCLLTTTDSAYGKPLLKRLEEVGVDTSFVDVIKAKNICYILEDEKQKRMTVLGNGMGKFNAVNMPNGLFENSKLCIFSIDKKINVDEFVRKIEELNFEFVFSMRSDRNVFNDKLLNRVLPKAKIIFCNENEETIIKEALKIKDIKELLNIGKAEAIVVTKGSDGSIIHLKDGEEIRIAAVKPEKIMDCTGAGDGYVAGFMYGYHLGLPYRECGKLGSTLSSFIIEKIGCITNSPTREQLFERYNSLS